MTETSHEAATLPTIEQRVEQIWDAVLRVGPHRTDATFLELAGSSMAAVQIVARIEDELGIEVDIAELFDDPDRARFARQVAATAAESASTGQSQPQGERGASR